MNTLPMALLHDVGCRGDRLEREAGQRQAMFFSSAQGAGLPRLGDGGHRVLFLLVRNGVSMDDW
ncbi:hypothetical protein ACQ3I4_16070 [Zafaria sp. Z1313]|uniref:hypothetical protein n=1 Tax=unclassified Zafaria TaxID=2828765 RepID=UPI002E76985D|nr:hypothetical protein [Zafaria sp. J156]MEE1622852.1 hypothetical protein [Zafaria sp. J156]